MKVHVAVENDYGADAARFGLTDGVPRKIIHHVQDLRILAKKKNKTKQK